MNLPLWCVCVCKSPDVEAEVEILGGEAAGLDGEAEPGGVDLEETERLLGVLRVGRFGDFGYVNQGAVGRIILLGQREGALLAREGGVGVVFGGELASGALGDRAVAGVELEGLLK